MPNVALQGDWADIFRINPAIAPLQFGASLAPGFAGALDYAVETPRRREERVAAGGQVPDRSAARAATSGWWQRGGERAAPRLGFDSFYEGYLAPVEGGYTARDGRSGAPANFGINQRANPDIDVRRLTRAQARQIMHDRYWVPSGAESISNPALQAIHADTAVNMGVNRALAFLQRSGGDPARYMQLRRSFYESLGGSEQAAWRERDRRLSNFAFGSQPMSAVSALSTPPPDFGAFVAAHGQGMAELAAAERAALTPTRHDYQAPDRPRSPTPEAFVAPDFSAGNAAFEAARPTAPFAEEGSRNRLLRQNYFRGMAEALLSINGGRPVGFGELLMRAGAGALAGRMAGEERAEAREREFEQQMQRYNAALASRNDQQAAAAATVLNQNVAARNEVAQRDFGFAMQDWFRNNAQEIVGGNLIVRRQGADGAGSISTIPISSMIRSQFALQRAQAAFSLAGPTQQHAQWNWQATQAQALQLAALGAQEGGQTGAEAVAVGISQHVIPMVESGSIANIIGSQGLEAIRAEGMQHLQINPQMLQADPQYARMQQDRLNQYITERVVTMALQDQQLATQLTRTRLGVAARAADRARGTRESVTTRRDARGRVSTSTSSSYSAD